MFAAPAQYYPALQQLQYAPATSLYGQGLAPMNLNLAEEKAAIGKDRFFLVSKNLYKNEKAKINEEYKLRREWIKEYSDQPKTDLQMLREWRQQAIAALDGSDISPEARQATKQYLEEQAELHQALDEDEAENEQADYEEDLDVQKREAIGDCWAKVDELEQVWYETYMHADDGAFGKTLFKQAKKHLDQQTRECKRLDKGGAKKSHRRRN